MSTRVLTVALLCLLAGAALAQDATQRRGFEIEITEPENQTIVFGSTRIKAEVKVGDPELVDRVEFLVGDEVIFIDREPPYECTHNFGEASKAWVVRAIAYHREDVQVSDAIITRKMRFATIEKVNRVILWVSATHEKTGDFIAHLERDDFTVKENDEPQQILEFYKEDRPITMALLLDSSGSMQDKLEEVHEAAAAFVDSLRGEDRAMVIDFDDKVFMIQELTSDHEAIKEAITSTEALGGTAIFDVLHAAYRKIGEIEGRKVIVLLTDGEDTFSQFRYKRVLEEAKSNNTMVYAIAIKGSEGYDRDVPRSFADVTGGRFFFVEKAEDLAGVYQAIAEELRTQFYLAYSTTNEEWDGRWIKIKVEHADEDIEIRARRGYFAVRRSMIGG